MSELSVYDSLKHVTGNRYNQINYNKDLLDSYILRLARDRGVRLPSTVDPERINFYGGYVETPTAGISDHVWYLDLASLYPNLIRTVNISPDTLIGTQADFEASEYDESEVVWSYIDTRPVKWLDDGESWARYTDGEYKMVYDPDAPKLRWADDPQMERCYYVHPDVQTGLVTEGVERLIELKYQFSGSLYSAIKRVVNSIFGFLSYGTQYNASRVYDWRLGESITLAGRRVIQYTADVAVEELQGRGYDDAYVAAGDTDAAAISLPSADSWEDCLDDVTAVAQYINETAYPEFMHNEFGVDVDAHYMEVEPESYARRLFVPAENPSDPDSDGSKKRYAQWMQLEDTSVETADVVANGFGFEKIDEVSMTGIEAVRSDTADATTELQTFVLERLVRDGVDARSAIFERLREAYTDAHSGAVDPQWLARRKGMSSDPSEYGSASRTPQPAYRGAKWANEMLDVELRGGDKPKYYAVDDVGSYRSTYRAKTAEDGDMVDWVSLPQDHDVPDELTIDYQTMTEKAIEAPLKPIIETMGWQWHDIESGTVDSQLSAYM